MANFLEIIATTVIASGIFSVIFSYLTSRKLEKETLQRTQAAKAATFFAKWAKYKGKDTTVLKGKDLYDYYEELTAMSYEMSLWIEDEKLLKEIAKRLMNKEGSKDMAEIIIEVRKLILNKTFTNITSEDIINWQPKDL